MALSPGVVSIEKDLTFNVQSITSNAAGYVGLFRWGPVNDVVAITTNESELVKRFGTPDLASSPYFHAAANYMLYSVPLNLVRVVGPLSVNAIPNDAKVALLPAIAVENDAEYEATIFTGYSFVARYPGDLGNSLKVSVCGATGYSAWPYANAFQYIPTGSQFNVAIIDEDGQFTGTPGTVLEKFELLTKTPGSKKLDGSSAYISEVLSSQSNFVLAGDLTIIDISTGAYTQSFVDGVLDVTVDATEFDAALDLFNNDQLELVRIFTSFFPTASVQKAVDIVDSRLDAIAFSAPLLANVYNNLDRVDDVSEYFETTINKPSSYHFQVDNWKLVTDKYNDTTIWIPCDSDAAGLHARVFIQAEPWFSPAGLNRGQLKNVIKLAWSSNQPQRDVLYPKSINSIVSFPGEGVVLFGDKTALRAPSAFSRINVRTLFIVIKRAIARSARYQLFEFNDFITQSLFRNATLRYLTDVQARRGIADKRVVADASNNTPQVIDANEFVGDIFVKPLNSINFIRLNFVAVGAGVSFEEIEG